MAYLYLMTDEPDRVRAAVPAHVAHWRDAAITEYVGGPFADQSGGLITFEVDAWETAEQLVSADPFVRQSLLRDRWLKEWVPSR